MKQNKALSEQIATAISPVTYEYFINLDERGEFSADVRNAGKTVFEIEGFDIFEDGFMDHKRDLSGLTEYLCDLGIIFHKDAIVLAN